MCSEVFLDINFTSNWLLLFFHIIWHWIPSYFSYVSDGIWETNNYLTTFRIYLPFCTFGRSKLISSICVIVSPELVSVVELWIAEVSAEFSQIAVWPWLLCLGWWDPQGCLARLVNCGMVMKSHWVWCFQFIAKSFQPLTSQACKVDLNVSISL